MTVRVLMLAAVAAAALAACSVTPPYQPPQVEVPASWKTEPGWALAKPDDAAARGPWWRTFGDAQLDGLEGQALAASPNLDAAAARLAQARSQVDVQASGLFPQLFSNLRLGRQKISANRPLTNYNAPNFSTVQNVFALSFSVAYEVDLWGRVRSSVDSARALAEQSAADFETVRLVLTTDLAANYFNLRELDIELEVLAQSIALQRRAPSTSRPRATSWGRPRASTWRSSRRCSTRR